MPGLNKSEQSQRFMQLMATKAGRKARLGDPDAFGDDPIVKAIVADINETLGKGVGVVDRLSRDESRTEVAKHHRAKQEAGEVNRALTDGAQKLKAIADERTKSAEEKLGAFLDINTINPILANRKMDWIIAQWQDANGGSMRIAAMVKTDRDLAAIMYRTDAYLLGIPDDKRMDYIEAGSKVHAPEAHAMLATADRIRTLADKLPAVANDVHASFYHEGIAEKMATRVED